MSTLLDILPAETEQEKREARKKAVHCVTPGCPHMVTEPWEESGMLCYECAIEGELFDRDARWDHVCPIPGTHCLPCEERVKERKAHLTHKARHRAKV
ncbi:MAG: hypothetical protein L6R30_07940 [Thermoanaerobaculia bacterium]|nr:hypothetical protein [Thermoanaerobaculia bacterium]